MARSYVRVSVDLLAECQVVTGETAGPAFEATVVDLSAEGALLTSPAPLRPGEAVSLRLAPAGSSPAIEVKGRVVRSLDVPRRYGVRFDALSDDEHARLVRLVLGEQHRRRQGGPDATGAFHTGDRFERVSRVPAPSGGSIFTPGLWTDR